jgi:hypothetical protein
MRRWSTESSEPEHLGIVRYREMHKIFQGSVLPGSNRDRPLNRVIIRMAKYLPALARWGNADRLVTNRRRHCSIRQKAGNIAINIATTLVLHEQAWTGKKIEWIYHLHSIRYLNHTYTYPPHQDCSSRNKSFSEQWQRNRQGYSVDRR